MSSIKLIAVGVLVLILIPIVIIDLRERRIPNYLNLILAGTGLLAQSVTATSFRAVLMGLIAPVAIAALFLGVIALMKLLRRPGTLGLGDVKFLAAASLWVGFVGSTLVFVVASVLALGFVIARAPWSRLDFKRAIAFGPFLAASLLLTFALAEPLDMTTPKSPPTIVGADTV